MKRAAKIITTTLFLLSLSPVALAVPGDFDADGTSDMSVARIDRTRNTTVWTTKPTNGGANLTWSFPQYADALVSGRYYSGNARYYPGLVKVTRTSEPLLWVVKNAAGQDVSFRYGYPGDTVNNLGDWNGDGVDDVHVARSANGVINWYVSRSGSGTLDQYIFGLSGDRVGLAKNQDGSVKAMIVLRLELEGGTNQFSWYVRDPRGTNFYNVKWGLPGDIPLIPHDLDGDGGLDFIVTRRTGFLQAAYIRFSNGGFTSLFLGFDSSIPQIGYFAGYPGFAWSQRDNGGAAIRNANGSLNIFYFGNSSSAIIRADGSVVQPSEDGRFAAGTTTGGSTGGSTGGDSGGGSTGGTPPTNPGLASVCPTTRGLTRGEIWKNIASTHIPNSDPRRFSTSFITRSGTAAPSFSCINAYDSNGNLVHKLGFYGSGGEYSSRNYGGSGCGDKKSGATVASQARNNTGSTTIYLKTTSNQCLTIPNPNTCYNSSGC